MASPKWAVYYDDGTRVTDRETRIPDLPSRGVLAVVQPDPDVGRIVISGHDYYVWRSEHESWYGVFDNFGLWDYLASPGWKRVLFGRTTDTETYRRVYEKALNDGAFPRKTAWDPDTEQERQRPPDVTL